MKKRGFAVLFLVIILNFYANSQGVDTTLNLKEVVVTGSRMARDLRHNPRSY